MQKVICRAQLTGQMIDVKATNVKLKQRAKNILRAVGGVGCTQSDEELESILEACQGSVKLAAVTIVLGVSVSVADEHLKRHEGVLTRVFEEDKKKRAQQETQDDGFVLCIDAGGTSCKAVVMSRSGATGNGSAGPCNAYVCAPDCMTTFLHGIGLPGVFTPPCHPSPRPSKRR